MDISWGFVIALILILFPGLIIRRLHYYGEFSKQFGAGYTLIKLIAISCIPGLFSLILSFIMYDKFISHISIEQVVNTCKDLNNPDLHITSSADSSINDKILKSVLPFLGFLYLISFFIGALSGRLIRISRLDTRFKLLRFKNYWFYVFSGEVTRFKKMKHLQETNKRYLFTIADILIDTGGQSNLYSGVVVDYELRPDDCGVLNKVMLKNAERYKMIEGVRTPARIPGSMLVVDCAHMKNINVRYVYERDEESETKALRQQRRGTLVQSLLGLVLILGLPFFIFQTDHISWQWYVSYFELPWYLKIIWCFVGAQFLTLLHPVIKNRKDDYEFVGWKAFILKLISLGGIVALLLVFG